ncbi:unnamed protein product, partial [Ectocarpus sp. 12 AP-2014]
KCVAFVGEEAALLASGGGDGDISLWPTNPTALRQDDGGGGSGDDSGDDGGGCFGADDGEERQRRRRRRRRRIRERDGEVFATNNGDEDCRGCSFVRNGGGSGSSGSGGGDQVGSVSPVLTLRAGAAAGKEKVRVWDVAANRQGSLLASASGDGAVRLWSLPPSDQLLE